MPNTPGKLIAIEGIDGSGKRTQVELLASDLRQRGYSVHQTGFPKYDSTFGKLIGQFLDGQLGPLETVDPRFTALLYAGDRLEAKPELDAALHDGQIVLADRYIGSNLAHQGARTSPQARNEFIDWIRHVEYSIYGLPREQLILYLRVPPEQAQKLVLQKTARNYTAAAQDLQEASLLHLRNAAAVYDQLSAQAPWTTIQCFDTARNAMYSPEEIAQEILSVVEPLLTQTAIAETVFAPTETPLTETPLTKKPLTPKVVPGGL
jgi:dTMP kinase